LRGREAGEVLDVLFGQSRFVDDGMAPELLRWHPLAGESTAFGLGRGLADHRHNRRLFENQLQFEPLNVSADKPFHFMNEKRHPFDK
jgi:hypothetical protein